MTETGRAIEEGKDDSYMSGERHMTRTVTLEKLGDTERKRVRQT